MISDLQKASVWKRISAALFDVILLCIVIVGAAYILSVVTGYDACSRTVTEAYARYEQQYGVSFELTQEQYSALNEEELTRYQEAYDALCRDDVAMRAYNMLVNLTLLVSSLGIFLGFLLMEFVVPLLLGNGQTLGKKIFGIALMRTDEICVNAPLMFIRTILGKYTIETMIPVLILIMIYFNMAGPVAILALAGIGLIQIVLVVTTKTTSPIHDVLAKTVAVDFASQRIFADQQEMIAYKNKLQAERAARQEY